MNPLELNPDAGPIVAYATIKAIGVAILFAAFLVYCCHLAKPKKAPDPKDGGDA